MSQKNLNKKRTIVICIFLSIFILGTVLIFTTPSSIKITYGLNKVTTDGETITFNVFEPNNGEAEKKAVIIGHGSIINKEIVKGYAIELAAAGFVTVALDFRGHGQSSGELKRDNLIDDVKAIKEYLISRGDIDTNNLGYIGYSMGGTAGNEIVKEDDDFKCFIGFGTNLTLKQEDYQDRFLNVLLMIGKYDEAYDIESQKIGVAERLGINVNDVKVDMLYGSFHNGTATQIIVDDNSDHLLSAWDQDFIRAARNWVKNTFPDVDPVDENFYVNIRSLILILQIIGGIGFFFLIIEPLSNLFVKSKEREFFKIELENKSLKSISKNTIIYSLALGILGIVIFIPLFLLLPLAMTGFNLTIIFGQVFAILILLWRIGKSANIYMKSREIKKQ